MVKSAQSRSQSARAELTFPVSRVTRYIRRTNRSIRVGRTASVYLAAVLEHLVSEVLGGSADVCTDGRAKRITPRHIQRYVQGNSGELDLLLGVVSVKQGGVLPNIHKSLLPKKRRSRKKIAEEEEE